MTRLLRAAGHDAQTVADADLMGRDDAEVLAYAKDADRALLTRNVRDFLRLHQADPSHAGILVEHQDADPAKNMTYEQIVSAVGKIEASGWLLAGELIGLNAWR